MNLQQLIDLCAAKKGAVQEFPFDDTTLVFKVMGKMFALVNLDEPHSVNLKCDPVYAIALRHKYKNVRAGYHMSKKHWNTIDLQGDVPDETLTEWIDDSYELVVAGLTKAQKLKLAEMKK
ncbi:MAG TPA: MmcQ/YjbR family DNA-binding protein [Caldithrix abyssi]|uniref:MmcQ/YjbR family DNA-binding protein n=1 Tax=Caldithrix abyssi TaxID=187145 RepID=A0A7V4UFD6_CALAY|nr:MmcQ/YjbR family DNA-binding protein [Caldithrix abyssi]